MGRSKQSVAAVTIAALMLDVSLVQAFLLEIGFFAFMLPYTMAYNWGYDLLRQRLPAGRIMALETGCRLACLAADKHRTINHHHISEKLNYSDIIGCPAPVLKRGPYPDVNLFRFR